MQYIGLQEIPDSFRVEKLAPTVREVVEGWLTDILTPDTRTTYLTLFTAYSGGLPTNYPDPVPTGDLAMSLEQYNTAKLITQFLCYAVWSAYIKKANAINTDTGYVTKLNADSDPITDRQRAELSNYYHGLAERKALELSRLVNLNTCEASGYSGRPLIRKAQPRSPSRLGN